jgi:chromosome segregation ATPase
MADDVMSLIPALLREIRDEIRATNTRLDGLTERVDGLSERVDANTRELIRHATAIVELEKGQREILAELRLHSRILEGHSQTLKEHTAALSLLIRKSDEQSARIDNVLLGVPGETMRDMQRRIRALEQKVGIAA